MIQLSDATVIINDEPVPVVPDSVKFNEGLGEQKTRTASVGGGKTVPIYAKDLTSQYGMVQFDMPSTIETIELARRWKANDNKNVVQVAGSNADGTFTRTFVRCGMTNNYDVGIGSDENIPSVFEGAQPV